MQTVLSVNQAVGYREPGVIGLQPEQSSEAEVWGVVGPTVGLPGVEAGAPTGPELAGLESDALEPT
ncbi:MAG: hypothetical protein ACO4AI_09665, partial [Prochlorothrix sp.]